METQASALAAPPKYWRYEPNHHELGRVIMRYLTAEPLTTGEIALIAVYLKRWIESPSWDRIWLRNSTKGRQFRFHQGLRELRLAVWRIHTRRDIEEWRAATAALGIDPF
jgi:hypothetical protein